MINTRYEIIKKLGEGRSKVYLCRDLDFPEKEYAIKILPTGIDNHELELFIKEFFTLKKLEHPGIIKAFEIGTVFHKDDEDAIEVGSHFIILEYFEGEILTNSKKIRYEQNLKYVTREICTVLYYLHQSEYIYYDLKPDNILVSFNDEIPHLRLIDLGLAEYSPSPSDYEIKGTAHYIAPELLKKENHNQSVDFYSLGILLYQLIYNRFPFEAQSELDIYKSAIESTFNFPPSETFSQDFINVVKKLLEKDVEKRYSSALTIINDLGFELNISITKEFLPAKIYSSRESIISALLKYFSDENSTEVYTIKGFDGVGKTSLLQKIAELREDAVIISNVRGKSGGELIQYFIRQIVFSKSVYPNLREEEKLNILISLKGSKEKLINRIRSIVASLTSQSKFLLLIDDFNLYDPLVGNIFSEIIPQFQVNNIKVVICESSEQSFLSSRINNIREINLGPFTKEEMLNFIEESYSVDIPQNELKDLINTNADLVPGNIKSFIKDLILFGIMKFSGRGVDFTEDENKISSLTEAHFSIYDLRLANLSRKELSTAKILSALEIYIDANFLSLLLGLNTVETEEIIKNLQLNNIIQNFTSGQTIIFTSDAIKKYIYASIENKKELHSQLAKKLSSKLLSTYRLEEARQYELAENYKKCFALTLDEINEAEKRSAFSYMQTLLLHLLDIPLDRKSIDVLKIRLSEVYFKLGDVQSSLKLIKELKDSIPQNKFDNRLFLIEGSALIASGEYEKGKKVIKELLQKLEDVEEKKRLKVELAYADFELKLYEESRVQCDSLLASGNLSAELFGRCYNLKGMIEIYQKNDLSSALNNFKDAKNKFAEADQPVRIAGAEVNIGNVYSILKEYDKAESHWKNASEINQSIGNLEQEGILLQSLGVFYFDRMKYDSAIQSYIKAQNIFLSLGGEQRRAQVFWNLGEVYLSLCDYQKALNAISEARKIFERINNFEEMLDVLFLLGKLYFKIGFNDKLEETFTEFNNNFSEQNFPSNYTVLRELFGQWIAYSKSKTVSVEKLKLVGEAFLKREDSKNFIESIILLVRSLLEQSKCKEAIKELNLPELMDLSSQNSILEAEREYFLGIVSKKITSDKLLPPMMYFEKAYELIKDENITELTWKVLYEISELYIDRGNLNRAKYFVTYSRELIYFIAERIESPRLRAAYLRQEDRLNTLKKLENLYPQK